MMTTDDCIYLLNRIANNPFYGDREREACQRGADALEEKHGKVRDRIEELPSVEITTEDIERWCRKRCCSIITNELFEHLKAGVNHGRWIDPEDPTCYKCSVCGKYATQEYGLNKPIFWRYCPNCGSYMDSGEVKE